jgi:transcriptional regulator with XRE-family HTH domain
MRVFSPTRLRAARESRQLTREELAKRVNRTWWNIRDVECGTRGISVDALAAYADALRVPVDALFEHVSGEALTSA